MDQNSEFNKWAENYREVLSDSVKSDGYDFSEYKVRELARYIADKECKLLDLGCGDGNSFRYVSKYIKNSTYMGIDVADKAIDIAKTNWSKFGADFVCYDGKKIPFDDESFDVVFIACVLHHVPVEDRTDLLKECHRVLKKDGMIIIFEHNLKNPITKKVVEACPFDDNAVFLEPKELFAILNKSGFADIKKRYTVFLPRKRFLKPFMGIEKYLWWCFMGGQYYCRAYRK